MNCPLCSKPLEKREVAPCHECGGDPQELDELARGEHEYHRYEVFDQSLVLCDFCDSDFASYFPETFGLPAGPCQEYPLERISRIEDPKPDVDEYCPSCQHRLAFLLFLQAARDKNSV